MGSVKRHTQTHTHIFMFVEPNQLIKYCKTVFYIEYFPTYLIISSQYLFVAHD